ncbi:MAG: hypothetical protein AAF039_09055 [Bacteroidota bacterium]
MLFQEDTLGYVYGSDRVKSIHIWDKRGATTESISVGTTVIGAKRRLKEIIVQESELESRVYLVNGKHLYQLNYYSV